MIVEVLLDKVKHFSCQVKILQHYHLRQGGQSVLLQHVLGVGRHGQVVLELHGFEDLVDDS